MSHNVIHESKNKRFVIYDGQNQAELTYQIRDDQIVFLHTGVPEALGGRGLGGALVAAGLDYAKANNLAVLPHCPFVASYIKKNTERQTQVAASFKPI